MLNVNVCSRLTNSHIYDLMRISIGGPEILSLRFPDSDDSHSHSEFSQFIDAAYSLWTSIPRRALEYIVLHSKMFGEGVITTGGGDWGGLYKLLTQRSSAYRVSASAIEGK
jgi:hypothetical protein